MPSALLRELALHVERPLPWALGIKMNFDPEMIAVIVVATVALPLVLIGLISKSVPKDKTFRCARCKSIAPHSQRTINAWRKSKKKFFCDACHVKWLETLPPRARERAAYLGGARSEFGCLGVVLLFAIVPGVIYVLVRVYA